jgi:hypothetical protein
VLVGRRLRAGARRRRVRTNERLRLDALMTSGRRRGMTNAIANGWWPNSLPRRRWAILGIAQGSQIRELYRWAKSSPGKGNVNEKGARMRVVTMAQLNRVEMDAGSC